jgi:hypothetical protein
MVREAHDLVASNKYTDNKFLYAAYEGILEDKRGVEAEVERKDREAQQQLDDLGYRLEYNGEETLGDDYKKALRESSKALDKVLRASRKVTVIGDLSLETYNWKAKDGLITFGDPKDVRKALSLGVFTPQATAQVLLGKRTRSSMREYAEQGHLLLANQGKVISSGLVYENDGQALDMTSQSEYILATYDSQRRAHISGFSLEELKRGVDRYGVTFRVSTLDPTRHVVLEPAEIVAGATDPRVKSKALHLGVFDVEAFVDNQKALVVSLYPED